MSTLPEYQKPHVGKPIIDNIGQIGPQALQDIQSFLTQINPQVTADSVVGLPPVGSGGVSTQTPGAVSTVTIPHLLQATPSGFTVQPADANSRGASAFYLTADDTNITLHFASALTAATSYSWVWTVVP